jgi:hypothetical protein
MQTLLNRMTEYEYEIMRDDILGRDYTRDHKDWYMYQWLAGRPTTFYQCTERWYRSPKGRIEFYWPI